MAFSDRFINVMDISTGPFNVPEDDLGTRALLGLAQFRDGPVTLYIGKSAVLRGGLDLPERAEVMMAPGAVVRLEGAAFWIIRGDTDFGVERRFDAAPGTRVEILGALDAIRPEWWWGSGPADAALEASIEVARARFAAGAPSAPIRLVGSYRLSRPWVIRPPVAASMRVVIEGMYPKGDVTLSPTLAAARSGVEAFPLVRIEAGASVIARHVAFDSAGPTYVSDVGDPPAAVDHAEGAGACTYERCTFFYGVADAMRIRARTNDTEEPRTTLMDCWFHCVSEVPASAFAVRASGGSATRLRVDGCSFKGPASAMVAIESGLCEVVACDFDNGRDISDPGTDIAAGFAALSGRDSKRGTITQTLGGLVLTETHVRSRSPRHLVGDREGQWPDSAVTLTGVVHEPHVVDVAARPNSVDWIGPIGGGLLIQGCDIGSMVRCEGPDNIVVVASTLRGTPTFDPDTQRRVLDAATVR